MNGGILPHDAFIFVLSREKWMPSWGSVRKGVNDLRVGRRRCMLRGTCNVSSEVNMVVPWNRTKNVRIRLMSIQRVLHSKEHDFRVNK